MPNFKVETYINRAVSCSMPKDLPRFGRKLRDVSTEQKAVLTDPMQGDSEPGAETPAPSAAYFNDVKGKCQAG